MTTETSARRVVAVTGRDGWSWPVDGGTSWDVTTDDVVLTGTPVGVQPPWPQPSPPDRETAGLAFDGCGSLFRGDPDRSEVQRSSWPHRAGTEPVDLIGDVSAAEPETSSAGFAPATAVRPALRAVALAIDRDAHLFLLDAASRSIAVVDLVDGRLMRQVPLQPGPPVDLAADGATIVVALASRDVPLVRLDAVGRPSRIALHQNAMAALAELPPGTAPARVAVDAKGLVWLLLRNNDDAWVLRVGGGAQIGPLCIPGARDLELDGSDALVVAGPAGGDLRQFATAEVRLEEQVPLGGRAYDGRGLARTPEGRVGFWTERGFRTARTYRSTYPDTGWVGTFAIDSGTPRQTWGRIFVEACVPPGTRLEVGFSTADDLPVFTAAPEATSATVGAAAAKAAQVVPSGTVPAPHDATGDLQDTHPLHRRETGREIPWTPLPRGDRYEVYEAPVIMRPGRYLWVRLLLYGTATLTPRIRAARIECESHDLTRQLPRAYRDDLLAESSLRRYLAMVDGLLREIEWRSLDRDRILDPRGAPAELLPWLGSLIGLSIDTRWTEQSRRQLLSEAIWLFRRRGTVYGLRRVMEIYLGARVTILESFRVKGYGGAFIGGPDDQPGPASAVIGQSLQVGGSKGGDAGYPPTAPDAFATHAHRFAVLVTRDLCGDELDVLTDLLDLYRPAHTIVEVCGAGQGMRVGAGLHVELSTVVGPGSPYSLAAVGASAVGAGTIVGRGRAGVRPGLTTLDTSTVVDP